MAERQQDVREGAVAVELEAVVGGRDPCDPGEHDAVVPSARLAQPLDVCEELPDARVITVERGRDERGGRKALQRRANGKAGERRRQTMAVALRTHPLLADRRRARAPGVGRIGIRSEDGDIRRRDARTPQRQVAAEPGQPRADDGDHFTEPASSPCTK